MSQFVSSLLHNSANKIENLSLLGGGIYNNSKSKNNKINGNIELSLKSRLAKHAPSPFTLPISDSNTAGCCNQHPQASYFAGYVSAPPPYDQTQLKINHSPSPSPSTSWTSEMSAFAEKIKDDVTSSFKSTNSSTPSNNVDRHSISQAMKLVSIAVDEYEQGNKSVALDIYLTGVDKILMAIPNKTEMNTKMAIREKLQSVEERLGIFNLVYSQGNIQKDKLGEEDIKSSVISMFLLSRIGSMISVVSSKAYHLADINSSDFGLNQQENLKKDKNKNLASDTTRTNQHIACLNGCDAMTRFKRLGQFMIDTTVTFAVLVKKSPIPDLVSLIFSFVFQLFLWIDAQYRIMYKAQEFSMKLIKMGLQADEKYHLHEFISEGLYMTITAGLKAVIAYSETFPYQSSYQTQVHQQSGFEVNSNDRKPNVPSSITYNKASSKSTKSTWTPW